MKEEEGDKIAVVCVLRSGGDFNPKDVVNLKNMLDKNISIPYEFYCLTDLVGVNWDAGTFNLLPLVYNYRGWWSKMELFRPDLFEENRVVFFDLDTIIVGNIDDLLLRNENFIGLKPFNPIRSKWNGYVASAIMGWRNNGFYNFLFSKFDYDSHTRLFRGDQDYLSWVFRENDLAFSFWQDLVGGIYSYKRHVRRNGLQDDARIICFHGKPRPNQVNEKWIKEVWHEVE